MNFEFEWDPQKAAQNLIKHGVSFEEAQSTFDDLNLYTEFDVRHSIDEARYISIGFSGRGRLLLIIHTIEDHIIRIISARSCTTKEARLYEAN